MLELLQGDDAKQAASRWRALPKAVARGDLSALAQWNPPQVVQALQKLCHDVWVQRVGPEPRYFPAQDLPVGKAKDPIPRALDALGQWARHL